MKLNHLPLLTLILLAGIGSAAKGAVLVTTSDYGLTGTIPGAANDFYLFGGSNPSSLADFSVAVIANQYAGDGRYSVVTTPDGTTGVQTGIEYQYGPSSNLATVTLGNTSFNYANFNLYFTYGNEPGDGGDAKDSGVFLTINGTTYSAPAVENFTNINDVRVEDFHITGLSAGDTITLGAVNAANVAYIGAVSFSAVEVPEPSAWALLGLGALCLVWRLCRSTPSAQS